MTAVEVLFKEYDTLRAEIIARTSAGFQVLAVSVVLFTAMVGWLGSHTFDVVFWTLLATFVIVNAAIALVTRREINIIAERIQEIEKEINRLMGATLLRWETERGSRATGWWITRKRPRRP